MVLTGMPVSLFSVLDVLKVDIGANVSNIGQVLGEKAGAATNVQHTRSRLWLRELLDAGFPRFFCPDRGLDRQVNRWKFEQRFHDATKSTVKQDVVTGLKGIKNRPKFNKSARLRLD